ncbi:hypothetical protein [Kitasatospora sp. NPDC090091]|uniref:hypothetical protein n=1 Tax=Kitasatospora sp. NPDC090091 TaxID=3364081 RepID=UPI00381B8A47
MKKFLAALAVAGTVAASVVAQAPAASAAGCVTGWMSTVGTSTQGAAVFTKGSSPCHDVNISWSYNSQGNYSGYAGAYRRPGGSWNVASRGYVQMDNGYHDINNSYFALITDLNPGAEFTVMSRNYGDQVTVTY